MGSPVSHPGQSSTRLLALEGATHRSPRSLLTGGGGSARLEHRERGSHGTHRHSTSPKTRRQDKQPLSHSLSNQEEVGLGDGLTHELQAAMRHAAARESELHVHHHHHHVCDVNRRTSHPPVRGAKESREIQTLYVHTHKLSLPLSLSLARSLRERDRERFRNVLRVTCAWHLSERQYQ